MKKIALISLVASSVLMAGGYKIPETSLNGVALSAANVAHNKSADAAYYNPANIAFMADGNEIEVDLTYIGLDAPNFKGTITATGPLAYDADAESETFFVPSINYVSPKFGNTRFGLSVVSPAGLSKRWDVTPGVYSAKEFTLQTVELNPSVAYSVNDKVAVAFGLRLVHGKGVVKSTASASRDMSGDSIDYGYNLALSYKPTSELEIGVTYRSKIDLTTEGDAKLYFGPTLAYNGGTSLTVPLPALVNVALAYTFASKTTVEFVYERNIWSAYETLDFEYSTSIGALAPSFDNPITKDWKDTNAYRLGITHELENMTLMAGVVIDETPAPDKTIGFELPDSDSLSVSLGARYQVNEKLNIGLATLYSMRDSRTINAADNDSGIDGKFSNSNVLLVSVGAGYKFQGNN